MNPAARILVIDDEFGVRSGIQQILEMEGYTVVAAATGAEGLAALDQSVFDVALIDYQLPDTDGLTVLGSLQDRGLDTSTCVITAYASIDMAISATRQGVDAFLPKPFSQEELLGTIETLLRYRSLRKEAQRLRQEHQASLLALASERSQMRSLVACLRDAVAVFNRDGQLVLVNTVFSELLHQEESAILHRSAYEVLENTELQPVRALLAQGDPNAVTELQVGGRDWAASVVQFFGMAELGAGRTDPQQQPLGQIVTLSNITAIKRASMEKARFIRTMVHELRSPLGAVRGLVEVVLEGSLGREREPYLPLLGRAVARIDLLVQLIGDLLSLARVDSTPGDSQLPPVLADLGETAARVFEALQGTARAHQVILRNEVSEGSQKLRISPEDLSTILLNLVGNGIKYHTAPGYVSVRAIPEAGASTFEVIDDGIGIADASLPRLFEEFFRERRKEAEDVAGHGLGLAIVKRLIDRVGGSIAVESRIHEGTRIRVRIP